MAPFSLKTSQVFILVPSQKKASPQLDRDTKIIPVKDGRKKEAENVSILCCSGKLERLFMKELFK